MSAETLQVRHVAEAVVTEQRWLAGCASCKWFPDPYFKPQYAINAAQDHNRVRHDNAAVTEAEHPAVIMMRSLQHTARQRSKFAAIIAGVYVLLMGALGWAVFNDISLGLTFLVWSGCVCYFGFAFGQWRERTSFATREYEKLETLFRQQKDDDES